MILNQNSPQAHPVELLMPVGGMEQFLAAVENGADAVYLGTSAANARMGAERFNFETLAQMLDFAHVRGVSVHVTMNTLLDDEEVDESFEQARRLYEMGVDALIIQDLGLAARIHTAMPEMVLHLSTQAGVTNIEGARAAAQLGFSRIVPARELTLEEISALVSQGSCEIEVFAHGAICVAYSGQCHMSRFIGGRSGNRGTCAQPCRLVYDDAQGNHRNALSPRDMCQIDNLAQLVDAGVTSFKVEGRLKSAEYVGIVCRIYRKYLDAILAHEPLSVTDEDRQELEQIFNRGFTTAFMNDKAGSVNSGTFVDGSPKHRGIEIGKVARDVPKTPYVELRLFGPLEMGDVIEIVAGSRPQDIISHKVTFIQEVRGGVVRVGDFREEGIPTGSLVRRLVSDAQLKSVRPSFAGDLQSVKENKKTPTHFEFAFPVQNGMPATLSASALGKDGELVTVNCESSVEEYESVAGERSEKQVSIIERQLKKTGSTPFNISQLTITGVPCLMKASQINAMRRDITENLDKEIAASYYRLPVSQTGSVSLVRNIPTNHIFELQLMDSQAINTVDFSKLRRNLPAGVSARIMISLRDLVALDAKGRSCLVKDLISENSDVAAYTDFTENAAALLESAVDLEGLLETVSAVYVGAFGNIEPLEIYLTSIGMREKIYIIADYSTNVVNANAAAVIKGLGADAVRPGLEAGRHYHGALPVMYSKHQIPAGGLVDRKGQKYRVIEQENFIRTITPDVPWSLNYAQRDIVADRDDATKNVSVGGIRLDPAYINMAFTRCFIVGK